MPITPITPEILMQMLADNPRLQVVDVRTPEEYFALGHLPQAKLIPLYELPYQYRVLNAHEAVVVTCQHGVRSVDACFFLQAQGFDKLYNLVEGMCTWTGPLVREIETEPKSPQPSEP